ncbi:hypothetical protein QZH41_004516 [Actinostola sp. cb2023]|nr:hypothetical protein QZH41_004516 [Actinostola sp. cb2023]
MDADKSNLTLESIYKVVTESQSNSKQKYEETCQLSPVATPNTEWLPSVDKTLPYNLQRNANTKIEWLETKIDDLEAQSRKYNIEIHGIPQTEDEDLEETTIKVAESVGVVLDEDDIDIVHRLYSKAQIKPILVKFKSHKTKNELYQARRKLRDVKASETFNGAVAVYINENLTAFRRRLYGEVRKRAYQNKWYRTWTLDGKIFVCKEKGERSIRINHHGDLESIY